MGLSGVLVSSLFPECADSTTDSTTDIDIDTVNATDTDATNATDTNTTDTTGTNATDIDFDTGNATDTTTDADTANTTDTTTDTANATDADADTTNATATQQNTTRTRLRRRKLQTNLNPFENVVGMTSDPLAVLPNKNCESSFGSCVVVGGKTSLFVAGKMDETTEQLIVAAAIIDDIQN